MSPARDLCAPDLPPACDLQVERHVAVLTLCYPPVNALSQRLCQGLHEGLSAAMSDPEVRAVVIICSGRTFCAGAEINELGKELHGPGLLEVLELLDRVPKPVVAAIHGTALGGGLELALASHYRIAVSTARVGLPEIALGLLPGGGGTQRLPRIVGIEAALELIALGKSIDARRAHELGILDELVPEDSLRAAGIEFARRIADRGVPRVRDRHAKPAGLTPPGDHAAVLERFRRNHPHLFQGFKAPENILKAVEAAATLPFDQGMQREAELFQELLRSPESAAQRYVFFAERAASKVPDVTSEAPALPVRTVGMVAPGKDLQSLAAPFMAAGLKVVQLAARPAALRDLATLAGCELIIEAGLGPLRRVLLEALHPVIGQQAILATTGSQAELSEIATHSVWAARVIGWHFLSPSNSAADATRLLEITRTAQTDARIVASVMRLARSLKAVALLSMAGPADVTSPGGIAARMQAACARAAEAMVRQGLSEQQVTSAVSAFGLPARLFGISAEVPVALPPAAGRHEGRAIGADADRAPEAAVGKGEIEQLLSLVAAEGKRLLEEGVALRSSDIDIAMIYGHGWPVYRGGPMWWAARRSSGADQ